MRASPINPRSRRPEALYRSAGARAQYGEIKTGVSADIRQPGVPDYREFTGFYQDGLNLRDKAGVLIPSPLDCGALPDAEDRGHKGFNYKNAPFKHRLGVEPVDATETNPLDGPALARVFSSKAHGDPDIPIFRAYADDPVRMRVLHGADKPRQHVFHVSGHAWKADPYDPGTELKGSQGGISVTRNLNLHLPGAGGSQGSVGDYRYGDLVGFHHLSGGEWGIMRVYPKTTSTSPTPIASPDDPRASGHPLVPSTPAGSTRPPRRRARPRRAARTASPSR